MEKGGQVTVFILLGVLLVVFTLLFFTITYVDIGTEKTQAKSYVALDQCVQDLVSMGVVTLSGRGGYYETPQEHVIYALEDNPLIMLFPYYYKDGITHIPSEKDLEEQFVSYLLAHDDICAQSILGTTFSQIGEASATVRIGEESITVNYDPGLAVVEGDSTTTVKDITIEVPSTYYHAYETAAAIAHEQNGHGNTFCLTCLGAYQDPHVTQVSVEEIALAPYYAIIYTVHYIEKSTNEEETFMFAGRYNIGENQDNSLFVQDIPDQTITIGYPYEYQVVATGVGLEYSDSSSLFDITSNGLISFYPDEEDIGTHIVEVTVTDETRDFRNILFYLEITHLGDSPLLPIIGYQSATVGEEFTYTIEAQSTDPVTYTDDSPFFDIGVETGIVSFTPSADHVGTHNILITATTNKGVFSTEEMVLVVTE